MEVPKPEGGSSAVTARSLDALGLSGILEHSLFIGGQWRVPAGDRSVAVVDPATEAAIGQLALGSPGDVDAAVRAARAAFAHWSASAVADRAALLDRVHALILERAETLAQAISLEMGAAISFARASQVPLAAEHVRVARDLLTAYPFVREEDGFEVSREPIGVCALITPWNWPLYQITAKVAPALAAGCTVVLKPSELSPVSALLFARILEDAGLPPGVLNLVNGTGPEVGEAMAAHADVDMISITGSTRAGVQVARAAAATVKRVTQELGGKSPNILLADADFERVVPLGVASAFRNVGQSCSAPTRMVVPRAALARVEALAAQAVAAMTVGDPASAGTVLGPVANQAQFARVREMTEAAIREGGKVIVGGPGRPEGLTSGFYVRPTVVSEVTAGMTIAQEEVFGPVLCLMPYDTLKEAIAIANDTPYGLSAHVQSADPQAARQVASRIRAGQVHINHPNWNPLAPFGGYKRSGNGREYGVLGFEEYLETKAIIDA